MAINEEDVKTYGLGQQPTQRDPVDGKQASLEMTPPGVTGQNSALSSTAQPQTVGAPLPSKSGALGGGAEPAAPDTGPDMLKDRGMPQDKVRQAAENNPDEVLGYAKTVANGLSKARKGENPDLIRGQAKQLEQTLKAQGADPQKAAEQLVKDYETGVDVAVARKTIKPKDGEKKKLAFRNVYNTIKPEEMSLFLIDFGLRAMMAGETMGTMGALGAAGSGALGALQGRREAEETKRVEDYKYGLEQGREDYKAESGRMRAEAAQTSAEATKQRAETSAGGYQGEKAFLMELGRSQGFSDDQMLQMFSGGELPTVRFQKWMDFISKTVQKAIEDPSMLPNQGRDPDTGKKYSEFNSQDMREWAERMIQQEETYQGTRSALNKYGDT